MLWLPPDVALAPDTELTAEDRRYAEEIRSEPRRAEFLRSRHMIRKITGWQGTLAKTRTGAPGWPLGMTGSLTHKDGWVGLTLGADPDVSAGIDAEDVARVKPEFESKILTPSETKRLDEWSAGDAAQRRQLLAMVFSLKEALFKAVYPIGAKMFYFPDAEATAFDSANGRFRVRLLTNASPLTPAGAEVDAHAVNWKRMDRHFVLTSVSLHGILNGGVGRSDGPLR